jgi:hypothetical protein
VDAAGEVTQFDKRVFGAAMGGVDKIPRAGEIGRLTPVTQVVLGSAQIHGQSGKPHLSAIVQVAFYATKQRRRTVNGLGPGLLQIADPAR